MSGSFATPWTVAQHAPLSMGFRRQGYWSGLPFPPPGNLPNPGTELESPAFRKDPLPLSHLDSMNSERVNSFLKVTMIGSILEPRSEFQSNILVNNPSFFLTFSSNQILILLYISRYMHMYIGIWHEKYVGYIFICI